ncbi:MAG: carbohydrate ABC transporter permease [Oscillospiraceae bacterium]|nr:carbohydrate ABC transporter permease [Oscillospiraceae bacterium]
MRRRNAISRSLEDRVLDTVNIVLLVIIAFITMYPFYYILILSFNDGGDAIRGGIYFWPRSFSLENFQQFFESSKWMRSLIVTVARTVAGTAIGVMFTCVVSYGLSKKDLVYHGIYMKILIIAMYFSGGLIPYYILLKSLRLLNTFAVYVIPGALNIFFVMICISFFRDIPEELIESAYLDGSTEFNTFLKIVLPVSLPLLATMTLFIGVGHWNSWIDSAYYVRSENLRTLSYRMMEVINQTMQPEDPTARLYAAESSRATTQSMQMAAMVVALGPIMCVYPFLQKYFAKGIMLGAVKG